MLILNTKALEENVQVNSAYDYSSVFKRIKIKIKIIIYISIFHGGPVELFLVPASAPRLV